jgi:hypothetical protein
MPSVSSELFSFSYLTRAVFPVEFLRYQPTIPNILVSSALMYLEQIQITSALYGKLCGLLQHHGENSLL